MTDSTTRARAPRRAGFTLIEVITVMGILGILTTITVVGVFRVQSAQRDKTTENTVTKLQTGLDAKLAVVMDKARNDKNPHIDAVLAACDNDRDRAKALLAYLYSKQAFPQTFAEARTTVNIGSLSLPALATFKAVPPSSSDDANLQAAALLYLILSEGAAGGVSFSGDATNSAETDINLSGATYRVYKDGWGNPISFNRWAQNGELDAAPYLNTKAAFKDPLDPLGKLSAWSNASGKTTAQNAVSTNGPTITFDNRNKVLTVIAPGQNKAFNGPTGTTDDTYGYRLRRQGNRGD